MKKSFVFGMTAGLCALSSMPIKLCAQEPKYYSVGDHLTVPNGGKLHTNLCDALLSRFGSDQSLTRAIDNENPILLTAETFVRSLEEERGLDLGMQRLFLELLLVRQKFPPDERREVLETADRLLEEDGANSLVRAARRTKSEKYDGQLNHDLHIYAGAKELEFRLLVNDGQRTRIFPIQMIRTDGVPRASNGRLRLAAASEWEMKSADVIEVDEILKNIAGLPFQQMEKEKLIPMKKTDFNALPLGLRLKLQKFDVYNESLDQPHNIDKYNSFINSVDNIRAVGKIAWFRITGFSKEDVRGYVAAASVEDQMYSMSGETFYRSHGLRVNQGETRKFNHVYTFVFDSDGNRISFKGL